MDLSTTSNSFTVGIPVFGRRESVELISKFWLQRDVRLFSSKQPLVPTPISQTTVHLASAQLQSNFAHNISQTRTLPFSPLSSPPQWLDQNTHDRLARFLSKGSIPTSSHDPLICFCDSALTIRSSRSLFLSNHNNKDVLRRMGCLPISNVNNIDHTSSTDSKPLPDSNIPKFPNIDDDILELTPVFEYAAFSASALHKPIVNSIRFILSLHHFSPTLSSEDLCLDFHLWNRGTATLNPSSLLSTYFVTTSLVLASAVPFIIITIDVCDISSINIAIWAYHALIYSYNNSASPFPDPSTPVLVMLFNTMALDAVIVTENQVRAWFENFPFPTQFHAYPVFHPLPPTTTLLDSSPTPTQTHSLPHLPAHADLLPHNNDIHTVNPAHPHTALRSDFEQTNIDFISRLDTMLMNSIEQHHITQILTNRIYQTLHSLGTAKLPPLRTLPCPIQSAIRYPFSANMGQIYHTGKSEELRASVTRHNTPSTTTTTRPKTNVLSPHPPIPASSHVPLGSHSRPIFLPTGLWSQPAPQRIEDNVLTIPKRMSHWCIFDKLHFFNDPNVSIHTGNRDGNTNSLAGRHVDRQSSGDRNDNLNDNDNGTNHNNNRKSGHTSPPHLTQHSQFDCRDTFHSCMNLSIKMCQFPVIWSSQRHPSTPSNSDSPQVAIHRLNSKSLSGPPTYTEKVWNVQDVIETIKTDEFHLMVMPMQRTGGQDSNKYWNGQHSNDTRSVTTNCSEADNFSPIHNTSQIDVGVELSSPHNNNNHSINNNTQTSTSQNDLESHQTQSSAPDSNKGNTQVRLVTQILNYETDRHGNMKFDSHSRIPKLPERNALFIDHYPTPVLAPILEYDYPIYILPQRGRSDGNSNHFNIDPDSINDTQDNPAQPQQEPQISSHSAPPSIPSILYQNQMDANRFYSISHITETAHDILKVEKPTLSATQTDLSAIFTGFPRHSLEQCAKLTQSVVDESVEALQHKGDQHIAVTNNNDMSPTATTSSRPQAVVAPLSHLPHHFNVFLDHNFITAPLTHPPMLTTNNLMTLIVVDLSTLHKQICTLLLYRFYFFAQPRGFFSTLFSFTPALTSVFRFSTYPYLGDRKNRKNNNTSVDAAATLSYNNGIEAQFTNNTQRGGRNGGEKSPPSALTPNHPISSTSPPPTAPPTVHRCAVDIPPLDNRSMDFRVVTDDLYKIYCEKRDIKFQPTVKVNKNGGKATKLNVSRQNSYCPTNFDLQSFASDQDRPGRARDRGISPHFLVIIDDVSTPDDLIWDATQLPMFQYTASEEQYKSGKFAPNPSTPTPNAPLASTTGCENNPHNDMSAEAKLINAYLSMTIPFGLGNHGPEAPLHYIFAQKDRLKASLIKCIGLALGMRMEKYESFEPIKKWHE